MTEPLNPQHQPTRSPVWKEQPLNLKKSLSRMVVNWPWFLLSLLLFLLVAFLINRYARPVYEVRTTLLFETDFRTNTGNEALGSDVFQGLGRVGSMRNIYDQSAMIVSTPLVEQVLEELDFAVSIYTLGSKGAVESYDDVPFTVEPDKNHVQAVGLPFTLEFTPEGQIALSAGGKEVALYDYTLAKTTGLVPAIDLRTTITPGTKLESPWASFTLHLREGFSPMPGTKYRFLFHTRQELLDRYKRDLIANIPEEKSSLLEIAVTGHNVAKAIDFLNHLTRVYQEDNLERKNNNASRTIDFISEQLQSMSDSLMLSQNELQQFRARTQVMDLSLQTPILLEQMNNLDQEKMVLETKNKYYAYLRDYISSNQDLESIMAPTAMGVDDPLLNNLIVELNRLVMTKSSLPSLRNSEHPQLKAINAQIERIKSTLLENANNILNQSHIALNDLNARLRVAQSRVNALPATERNYVNIERKYKLNNEILTFLLQKFSEAQIAKASNLPDSQVIEPAYFNKIVFPKRTVNYLLALFLSLLIPLFILYLKDYFSNKITTEEDIRAITPLPILGNIYKNKKVNNTPTLVLDRPNSPASELYRAIRGKLSLITADRETPIIAVASTFPNEGKTYNAINIASSFALMKKKTVLIDFDLRNSAFSENFGFSSGAGVVTYIQGRSTLADITFRSKHPYLDLIPAGPRPPDPGDILAGPNIFRLLDELRNKYQMVIIDNLPVGLVADLFQLRDEIDATVFVVRHGFTRRTTLRNALAEVSANKMKNVGILVNGIEENKKVFGYGYNNDYIYGEKKERGSWFAGRKKTIVPPSEGLSEEDKRERSVATSSNSGERQLTGRAAGLLHAWKRHFLLIIPLILLLLMAVIAFNRERDPGSAVPGTVTYTLPPAAPEGTARSSAEGSSAEEHPPITSSMMGNAESTGAPVATTAIIHPAKGVYYIIVKSLENKEKAEEYLRQRTGSDLRPFYLGLIGKYHMVAIDSFRMKNEAYRAVEEYKRSGVSADAWVYRH